MHIRMKNSIFVVQYSMGTVVLCCIDPMRSKNIIKDNIAHGNQTQT